MMMAKKTAMKKGEDEVNDSEIDDASQKASKESGVVPANGHASSVVPDLIPGKAPSSESEEEFKPALDHFDDDNALLNQLERRYGQPRKIDAGIERGISSSEGVDLLTGSPATADRQIKSKQKEADVEKQLQEMRLIHQAEFMKKDEAFELERKEMVKREKELERQLRERELECETLVPQRDEMTKCIAEYEKTITQLIAERENATDGYRF